MEKCAHTVMSPTFRISYVKLRHFPVVSEACTLSSSRGTPTDQGPQMARVVHYLRPRDRLRRAYKISGGANGSFFLGSILTALLTAMTAAALAANPVLFFAALGVGLVYLFADTAYGFDVIKWNGSKWRCVAPVAEALAILGCPCRDTCGSAGAVSQPPGAPQEPA